MTSKMVVKFYSGNVAIKHNVTMQTFLRIYGKNLAFYDKIWHFR